MGEDVELCLEIQVDPESKKILSSARKCRSALLDVTVVKPKELEAFGTQITNTLRADEVRKLIASMERQRRKKQKVLDRLKDDDTIIKIRKHEDVHPRRKARCFDDLERKDFIGIAESVEPLFCEIRRSLKNVEARITNMKDINLTISQSTIESDYYARGRRKHRLVGSHLRNASVYRAEETFPCDKSLYHLTFPNDSVSCRKRDKLEGKCLCENCGTVGLLRNTLLEDKSRFSKFDKWKSKEDNEAESDEMTKRSRFDKWKSKESESIEKLNKRIKELEERLAAQEEKVVPKDYFKRIITKMVTNFSPAKSKSDCTLQYSKPTRNKSPRRTERGTGTDEELLHGGYIWRWGEEILRPGVDLKNRIVTLLNEILSKVSVPEKSAGDSPTPKKFSGKVVQEVYHTRVDTNPLEKSFETQRETMLSEYYKKLRKQTADVSYMNPKVWKEDERISDDSSIGKEEFLRIVSKAKQQQKDVLWKNIWNQAVANGQTRQDKITIKIPSQSRKNGFYETEITIGEVEEILSCN